MIISKDIHPGRDYYYLGAKIIEILSYSDNKRFEFFTVFEKLKSLENVSVNLFTLTLDWLFIIGVINKPEEGCIVKCF